MKAIVFTLFLVLAVIGFFKLMPESSAKYAEPTYLISKQQDSIEFRHYEPFIVAEVLVYGDRQAAASEGFRLLFSYISGANQAQEKIAMTIPVFQELVGFDSNAYDESKTQWAFRFVMPLERNLQNLPAPLNDRIVLKEIKDFNVVAMRFSGSSASGNLVTHKNKLDAWTIQEKTPLMPNTHEIYALYNAPFTPPFLKRNEVMFRIER
jgi:hypothetical protein